MEGVWVSTKDRLPPVIQGKDVSRPVLFITEYGMDFAVLEYHFPPKVRRAFIEVQQKGEGCSKEARAIVDSVDLDNLTNLVPFRWTRNVGIREQGKPYFDLAEVAYWLPIPNTPEKKAG